MRYETIYLSIRNLHDTISYPISLLCDIIGIQRSSYYKWLNRKESENEKFNKELLSIIKDAYEERNGILGYRQMTIKLNREHHLNVNYKRIYRLMRISNLKSVCRRKRKHIKGVKMHRQWPDGIILGNDEIRNVSSQYVQHL